MRSRILVAAIAAIASISIAGSVPAHAETVRTRSAVQASVGEVSVQGNRLLRDGQPWIPHGFHQIAFVLPPGVAPQKPFFKVASDNYTPKEYNEMRDAGADSVRIQVAQTGMDPQNHMPRFRDRVFGAIRSARAAGLTVIVSVQDQPQTGETKPAALPNDATRRVWEEIAPVFRHDRGVLFELLNEPFPPGEPFPPKADLPPSSQNWQAWAQAMNETIHTVRKTDAVNVVVADGMPIGEYLENAPLLSDPLGQVAYASHPYAHNNLDQIPSTWDKKFGNFSRKAPVIITEWGTGYHCDANTPMAVVTFLQYLQDHGIGLEVVAWDWQPPRFGSAVYDFPHGRFSSFVKPSGELLSCEDYGFGLGKTVEAWYRTGVPPTSPK